MTKVAIITDTHFGARGDSLNFLEYFEKFYNEVFWPTVYEHRIETVIHLGDLVDKKKMINYYSYHGMRRSFLDKFHSGLQLIIVPGNHDSFYKNTIQLNAATEILQHNRAVEVITSPTIIDLGNQHQFLMMPWICEDNYAESIDLIKSAPVSVCMGHFELTGFKMNRARVCENGLSPSLFSKFKRTFSGHFHHKSDANGIYYLGAPYEITWEDWNDTRGFHIYDFDKDNLAFIKNPYRIHEKLEYNASLEDFLYNNDFDYSHYRNKYVKLLVKEKNDIPKFMNFVEKLEASGALSVAIVEDKYVFDADETDSVMINELEDTRTIMNRFIEQNEISVNKPKLMALMEDLYKEAVNVTV
jgi:DNA repair exonuclease SbcCD nuclease subunit